VISLDWKSGVRVSRAPFLWPDWRLDLCCIGGEKYRHGLGRSGLVWRYRNGWLSMVRKQFAWLMHDWHALERFFATKVYSAGVVVQPESKWLTCQGFLPKRYAKVRFFGGFLYAKVGGELRRARGLAMLVSLFRRQKTAFGNDAEIKKTDNYIVEAVWTQDY
tara:strand:- start:322 stop:807 length:486 start_codon:yes stop_codon:yes gene_type:complete